MCLIDHIAGVGRDVVDDPGLHARAEEPPAAVGHRAEQVLTLSQIEWVHLVAFTVIDS